MLIKKYSWSKDDARITIFTKCSNVFEPIVFSLMFEKDYLRKPEYLAQFSKDSKTPPSQTEINYLCYSYLMFQQMAFLLILFFIYRSSFRLFVRIIDKSACNGATSNFQSVYRYLLKKCNQKQYDNLLELWRLIRNTQHNNGVYVEFNQPLVDVNYKGKNYNFRNNEFFNDVNMYLLFAW